MFLSLAPSFAPDPQHRVWPASGVRRWGRTRGGILLKLMALVVFVILLGIVYLARHPLLRAAGRFWIVDESPLPSDAIVILGDDNYLAERAARAAELYHAGWAPRVVASGRFLRPYASIAELMQHDLTDRGVPAAAVVRFTQRPSDTHEELVGLNRLITERGWRHVLVVTSNYHTRRTRYILEHTFAPGIEWRVVAARDSEYDPDSWWMTRLGIKLFFHEAVGMVVAMWELRHSAVAAGIMMAGDCHRAGSGRREGPGVGLSAWVLHVGLQLPGSVL